MKMNVDVRVAAVRSPRLAWVALVGMLITGESFLGLAPARCQAEEPSLAPAVERNSGGPTPLAIGTLVPEFSLTDFRGQTVSLSQYRDTQLVVVAFLGTECPLAQIYGTRLSQLAETYTPDRVVFLGISSNSQDSLTELASYAQRQQIGFPLLKDVGNRLADQMGARRTPEVWVLDRERRVQYRGRIDDQYGVGYVREQPQRRDLHEALEELLAGQAVTQPTTDAPGCLIGRVRVVRPQATVTFAEHIAPLLNRRCVECHHDGDIAPFALTDYDEVAGWAEMIAEVVRDQRMPPWHAADDGVQLAETRRLTEPEKQLILDWVADGAPAGDLTQLPAPPVFTSGWQLPRQPDLVVPMQAEPFDVPAEGAVRYQYFTAPSGVTEDRWIQAVEVMPGNRAVVHHVLVFAKPPGGLGEEFSGGVHGFLAGYVPGLRSVPFPTGMAKRLPAGSELIFQLHYTPIGSAQTDLSQIGFVFAADEEVTHEVRTVSAFQPYLNIPRGAARHEESTKTRLDANVLLLGLMPHLHLRGSAFQYLLHRPGVDGWTNVLNVPSYDFNWQTNYRLAAPMELPAGSYVKCVAHFDNSDENLSNPNPNQSVTWGEQTWEEMLIGYFDIAIPRQQADSDLALQPRRAEEFILQFDRNDDFQLQVTELPWRMRLMAGNADQDRNGLISPEELKQAFAGQRRRARP